MGSPKRANQIMDNSDVIFQSLLDTMFKDNKSNGKNQVIYKMKLFRIR